MAVPLNTSIPNTARVCGWQIARKARRGKQHRAPFSCGTKEASASQRGKQNKSLQIGVHGGFAGRDTQTQALHSSVQPAYSFSTYRDEGSLSEVAIADYLSGKAVQGTTAEVQAVCALTLPAASDGVQIAHCIESSLAQETARRRQQRSCYPASHADSLPHQALQQSWSPVGNSNFLERRPKVQVPSRLQGCVTEVVPDALTTGDNSVMDGDAQLVLWYRFAAAQKAMAVSVALHTKLGRRPASSQIAATVGLPSVAALARCLADGKSAKLQLVAANLGLVRKLAHDYKQGNEVSFQDLVQAGLWGLDKGLVKYDPTRGAKLSTAVYWYIRDAIFKTYRLESQIIHIPLTTQEQMGKLRAIIQQYQQQHPGQMPSFEHFKKGTGLGKLAIQRVLQVSALSEYSLDVLAGCGNSSSARADSDHDTDSLLERLAGSDVEAEHAQAMHLLQLDLQSLLTVLPDPMGVIVQEKYGLLDGHAKTFEEVSHMLNIKRWKVQEYHRIALKSLRASEHVMQLAHAV